MIMNTCWPLAYLQRCMNCLKRKIEIERSAGVVRFDDVDRLSSEHVLEEQKRVLKKESDEFLQEACKRVPQ